VKRLRNAAPPCARFVRRPLAQLSGSISGFDWAVEGRVIGFIATIAKMERQRIVERTQASIAVGARKNCRSGTAEGDLRPREGEVVSRAGNVHS